MSDETPQTPDEKGALDLSALNFGPAWARDSSESKSVKKFKDRGDRGDRNDRNDRGGQRGRGGPGGGRRDFGGGGGGRDRRGGGGGDRRGGGGGFKGKGRYEDRGRNQRFEAEPPQGVTMKIMPLEESLDTLAKQVIDSGRTYSVFDFAKVLLQSRDRFRVTYESKEKPLFRCREDQSVWVTKDEALRHLWRGDWISKFYEEVKVEGEAPKGSFSSVAKCGLSGELLGPPNYHGYQEKLNALHREKFSNMSLDAYKAKVRMEHGEEAVEAWLESMKQVTKWKKASPPKEEPEAAKEEVAEASAEKAEKAEKAEEVKKPDEVVTEEGPEPVAEVSEAVAETEEVVEEVTEEVAVEEGESAAEEPASSEESEEAVKEDEVLFDDARAVERDFSENHFEKVFEVSNRAWVLGDIKGNLLSPGLLTLLKRGVAEEKRYPATLMPLVCRQLSGRHVAVFKWQKKLKVGPSRPHAVSSDMKLAERPQAMIDYLSKNDGTKLQDFWPAVRPADVSDEQKHEWLQDFQWLLSQGHILLMSDTTIHLAKQGGQQAPAKKAAKKKAAGGESKVEEAKVEEAKVEEAKVEESKAEESKAEESKAEESKAEEAKVEAIPDAEEKAIPGAEEKAAE